MLLFNIATVLGPRWIASAAHNGTSSVTLWILAAVFFFVPTALVIVELSTRFPEEGGLYAWSKTAFGEFHGFVAGWTYWVYTLFYFPALLFASASMAAYIGGIGYAPMAQNRTFLLDRVFRAAVRGSLHEHHRASDRKVAAERGGCVDFSSACDSDLRGGVAVAAARLSDTLHVEEYPAALGLGDGKFLAADRVCFFGDGACFVDERGGAQSAEDVPARDSWFGDCDQCVLHRGNDRSAVADELGGGGSEEWSVSGADDRFGCAQDRALGMIAAMLVTVGNAGGVGSTVAGIARVPFVVGLDRYLPRAFGKIHPKWETPYVSILVQAIISGVILLLIQINETTIGAYQILVAATKILYFIPFLYMYGAVIRLASRRSRGLRRRSADPRRKDGVWIAGGLGLRWCWRGSCFRSFRRGQREQNSI